MQGGYKGYRYISLCWGSGLRVFHGPAFMLQRDRGYARIDVWKSCGTLATAMATKFSPRSAGPVLSSTVLRRSSEVAHCQDCLHHFLVSLSLSLPLFLLLSSFLLLLLSSSYRTEKVVELLVMFL